MNKVQALQERAQKAYDSEDPNRDKVQAWFNALPEIDLGVLWGLACSEGVAYDDEVYEALASRGWFDDKPEGDGLLCILCRYIGLNHDGDHIVPGPKEGT